VEALEIADREVYLVLKESCLLYSIISSHVGGHANSHSVGPYPRVSRLSVCR